MIIKACISTINPLCFRLPPNRIKFKIEGSLKLPQSGLSFPASGIDRPSLIQKQNARSLSFPCPSARTEVGSDLGLWRQYAPDPELLTHSFVWMLFLWFVWMLLPIRIKDVFFTISKLTPKWVVVVSSLFLLMIKFLPKSKEKKAMNVSFDDLVGIDDVKSEFQVILRILKGEGEYKKLNLPDRILLYGPPSTGKSTLVHAFASESKLPFFPVTASDLASDRPLDGAVEIKKLFLELYIEMDKSYRDERKVVVIAETNRPEALDMMSSGCFYTRLHVAKLNKDAKRKIIGLHLKELLREKEKEVICNLVASGTPDLVWGQLKNIAYHCARIAVFRGDDHVTTEDVLEALGCVNY